MPARAESAGFTLVETLVALAATALIMAALATLVPAALRAYEGSRARLDRATVAGTVLARLERELTTALDEPFVLDAARARLQFTGGDEPGEQLAYGVERDAWLRHASPRFSAVDTGVRGDTVLDGVHAVELGAFDGRDWLPEWQSSRPPAAVRIRIAFTDGEVLRTVVPIPTARSMR